MLSGAKHLSGSAAFPLGHGAGGLGSCARGSGQEGFTLLELLIVIAIILTLAAIIIPKIMPAEQSAHRAAILAELRVLRNELSMYEMDCGGYPESLDALDASPEVARPNGGIAAPDAAAVSGYRLSYTATNPDGNGFYKGYTLTAEPSNTSADGDQFYFMDQTGVVRAHSGTPATASDPAVIP